MQTFAALITPIALPTTPPGVTDPPHPDHTLPDAWPHPEHPIYFPLPPGAPVDPNYGIDINAPHPDHTLPGAQPRPDQGLPKPQPRPDHDLPGAQPHPEHPIVLPPNSGGWDPVFIWGPGDGRPTPPIVIPPDVPPTGNTPPIKFVAAWTPTTGWVVIGIPQGAHPTPSKRK